MNFDKLEAKLKSDYPNCVLVAQRLKDGKYKGKEPMYPTKQYNIEQLWNMWNIHKSDVVNGECNVGILIRGDLVVVDFDNRNHEHMVSELPEFDTIKVKTSKGFHYYFKRTTKCDDNKIYTYQYQSDSVDILTKRADGSEGSIVQIPPSNDKEWIKSFLDTKPLDFDMRTITWLDTNDNNRRMKRIETEQDDYSNPQEYNNDKTIVNYQLLEKIVMNLGESKYGKGTYDNWLRTIFAIKNLGIRYKSIGKVKAKELAYKFSKQDMSVYSRQTIDDIFKVDNEEQRRVGLRTLLNFLKEDDINIYYDVIEELNKPFKGFMIQNIEPYEYANIRDVHLVDYDYNKVKEVFEQNNFRINNPVSFVEVQPDKSIIVRNKKDFTTRWETLRIKIQTSKGEQLVDFTSKWYKDPTARCYDKVDFYPNENKCPKNVFNNWRGLAIEREEISEEGDYTFFTDLLFHLVNNREDVYNFLMSIFANMIQNPDKPCGIATALYSETMGIGKNIALDTVRMILGFDDLTYETCDPAKDIFGRFANGRAFKLMIVVDETQSSGHYNYADNFKNYITSLTMNIEQKGIQPITIKNYNNWFFTTNNVLAFKISMKDRRYFIIDCCEEKLSAEYYKDYADKRENPANLKALYNYLKSYDISNIRWEQDRPITELYTDLQMISLDPISKFVVHLYHQITSDNADGIVDFTTDKLYSLYNEWCTNTKHTNNINNISFGILLKKKFNGNGFEKIHTRYGNAYNVKTNVLREYLIKNKMLTDELSIGFKIIPLD